LGLTFLKGRHKHQCKHKPAHRISWREHGQVALEGNKVALEGNKGALEGNKVALEGNKVALEGNKKPHPIRLPANRNMLFLAKTAVRDCQSEIAQKTAVRVFPIKKPCIRLLSWKIIGTKNSSFPFG
jgi:hypothetical protein